MPTYVYKFIDTGETVEVQQSFADATLTEFPHPKTGEAMPVKKVFLPVGVTFKGDGFYKTDSRSASKSSKKGSNGDAESSKSSSESSSSESSTASSSESTGSSKSSSSSETSASSSGASKTSSSPSD